MFFLPFLLGPGEICIYQYGWLHPVRPVSSSEASVIQWGRPNPVVQAKSCEACFITWSRPYPIGWLYHLRQASSCAARLILLRTASSCEAGLFLRGQFYHRRPYNVLRHVSMYETSLLHWGWPHSVRPATTCEAGLFKPKPIVDSQPFGLKQLVAQFMSNLGVWVYWARKRPINQYYARMNKKGQDPAIPQ